MKEKTEEQVLVRRSMRLVLLLSVVYALAGNIFFYSGYYNNNVIEWSYLISVIMIIAFALPVVMLFRNRHWYFPLFIFLFWIPFSVLIAFLLSRVLPLSGEQDLALMLFYFLILNLMVILVGIALGMSINGFLMLWKKLKRPTE
ncbi:hypothetical protein [Paenibacillus sp. sgz302251]|uniref:hypothetical protein n=1 Tax=Paenibacillus sp. sgz302251 TaxID=3414493 RepID=UPI003C7CBC82